MPRERRTPASRARATPYERPQADGRRSSIFGRVLDYATAPVRWAFGHQPDSDEEDGAEATAANAQLSTPLADGGARAQTPESEQTTAQQHREPAASTPYPHTPIDNSADKETQSLADGTPAEVAVQQPTPVRLAPPDSHAAAARYKSTLKNSYDIVRQFMVKEGKEKDEQPFAVPSLSATAQAGEPGVSAFGRPPHVGVTIRDTERLARHGLGYGPFDLAAPRATPAAPRFRLCDFSAPPSSARPVSSLGTGARHNARYGPSYTDTGCRSAHCTTPAAQKSSAMRGLQDSELMLSSKRARRSSFELDETIPSAKARRTSPGGWGGAAPPLATSSASCQAAHRILRALDVLDTPLPSRVREQSVVNKNGGAMSERAGRPAPPSPQTAAPPSALLFAQHAPPKTSSYDTMLPRLPGAPAPEAAPAATATSRIAAPTADTPKEPPPLPRAATGHTATIETPTSSIFKPPIAATSSIFGRVPALTPASASSPAPATFNFGCKAAAPTSMQLTPAPAPARTAPLFPSLAGAPTAPSPKAASSPAVVMPPKSACDKPALSLGFLSEQQPPTPAPSASVMAAQTPSAFLSSSPAPVTAPTSTAPLTTMKSGSRRFSFTPGKGRRTSVAEDVASPIRSPLVYNFSKERKPALCVCDTQGISTASTPPSKAPGTAGIFGPATAPFSNPFSASSAFAAPNLALGGRFTFGSAKTTNDAQSTIAGTPECAAASSWFNFGESASGVSAASSASQAADQNKPVVPAISSFGTPAPALAAAASTTTSFAQRKFGNTPSSQELPPLTQPAPPFVFGAGAPQSSAAPTSEFTSQASATPGVFSFSAPACGSTSFNFGAAPAAKEVDEAARDKPAATSGVFSFGASATAPIPTAPAAAGRPAFTFGNASAGAPSLFGTAAPASSVSSGAFTSGGSGADLAKATLDQQAGAPMPAASSLFGATSGTIAPGLASAPAASTVSTSDAVYFASL